MDKNKCIVSPALLEVIIKEFGEDYASGFTTYQTKAEIESLEIIERLNKRFNS